MQELFFPGSNNYQFIICEKNYGGSPYFRPIKNLLVWRHAHCWTMWWAENTRTDYNSILSKTSHNVKTSDWGELSEVVGEYTLLLLLMKFLVTSYSGLVHRYVCQWLSWTKLHVCHFNFSKTTWEIQHLFTILI